MKIDVLLICILGVLVSCQSKEKSPSDLSLKDGTQNYTIVDFESLPDTIQEKMINSFFVPHDKINALVTKPVSISEAQGFVRNYSNLISNKFLKEVPGSTDKLASIPLRTIIHSNICPTCDASFPSYGVDVDLLHDHVVKNRNSYPNIKYLQLYPAIRVENGKRVFTMVLVGLDAARNFVLKKGANQKEDNFILEYIDPCNPRCRNVGQQ